MNDTIFALATAGGRGAIAVIRLSGTRAGDVLQAIAGTSIQPRCATLRRLRDPATQEMLDRALVLWFPAPASYTGEDVAEIHLHGGLAVVDAVSRALLALDVRPARPGEFTRRAFDNQRLGLAEAEAVADLIDAQTDAQRRQALRQQGGALTEVVAGWREALLAALAHLEAAVDFPDEDIPEAITADAGGHLENVHAALRRAANDRRGEQVREGYRIALVGPPNSGKSSLFNALVGRDAAMVSPQPGTTRDVVEAHLTWDGHAIVLADTAGVDETPRDELEREGMRRAQAWAQAADLRLHIASAPIAEPLATATDWSVLSKSDLLDPADCRTVLRAVSVVTGEGVGQLRSAIARAAMSLGSGEPIVATRARHREAFGVAGEHLDRAICALHRRYSPELAAEDVRLAARALESLTGYISTEEVLGRVFTSFCIGK